MTVHLVGAGPGDPDLLTIRAGALLAAADVVVHDRLIDPRVLGIARRARLIDVGKRPGGTRTQEGINELLVDLARMGFEVVRLKGGDPFLFGRGGEETLALAAAGVPFTVVPGVTSAFAAPAAAGVPVTHRGVSAAVSVVTGHRQRSAPPVDWEALARVGGTIVVLMGVAERAAISDALVAGGLQQATPVTAVESATVMGERVHRCTLGTLVDAPIQNPCVIVIGEVAALDVRSFTALAESVA